MIDLRDKIYLSISPSMSSLVLLKSSHGSSSMTRSSYVAMDTIVYPLGYQYPFDQARRDISIFMVLRNFFRSIGSLLSREGILEIEEVGQLIPFEKTCRFRSTRCIRSVAYWRFDTNLSITPKKSALHASHSLVCAYLFKFDKY